MSEKETLKNPTQNTKVKVLNLCYIEMLIIPFISYTMIIGTYSGME